MIKKITALILSLSLSLCSTAAFSFADNKDIKEDTLYENMMKQKICQKRRFMTNPLLTYFHSQNAQINKTI